MIPTVLRQQRDNEYHVTPKVPDAYPATPEAASEVAAPSASEAGSGTGLRAEGAAVSV